jgi:DNA polymerase-1
LPEAAARAKWGDAIKRAFTHKALNRVLQGSAADLMKKAMRDIWRSGVYRFLPVAHLTVHDELDHSGDRSKQANQAIREVKEIMETALQLKVPIIATEERGPNWGECK